MTLIPIPEFTNYFLVDNINKFKVVDLNNKPVPTYKIGDTVIYILSQWGFEYHINIMDLLNTVCLGPEWHPRGEPKGLRIVKKVSIASLPPKPVYDKTSKKPKGWKKRFPKRDKRKYK